MLYRAAWHAVLWMKVGLPEWAVFQAEIRGEAPPRKSAKDLLRVAEAAVKVFGGRDLRKAKAAPRPGPKEVLGG